jgi:hypothetical protein
MSFAKFSKSIYKSFYYFKTMLKRFFTLLLKVQMLMKKIHIFYIYRIRY